MERCPIWLISSVRVSLRSVTIADLTSQSSSTWHAHIPLHRHPAYLGRLLPQAGDSPTWSRMLKPLGLLGRLSPQPGPPRPLTVPAVPELRFHSWSKPKPLRPPQLQDHPAVQNPCHVVSPTDTMQHDFRVHNQNSEELKLGCLTFNLLSSVRVPGPPSCIGTR